MNQPVMGREIGFHNRVMQLGGKGPVNLYTFGTLSAVLSFVTVKKALEHSEHF